LTLFHFSCTHPATTDLYTLSLHDALPISIGSVAYGGRKEASRAIQAAENSFMNWKNLTAKERGSILEEIYNLMIQERKELAYTLTLEQGKPLKEAEGEINQVADFVK